MKRRQSPAKSRHSHSRHQEFGQFRIIGGLWRGRKLQFPATDGLRPTPDRIRETLFNWLSTELDNARCLDLFCGSGALGLEALSRGAQSCTFIDAEPKTLAAITSHINQLPDAKGKTVAAALPEALSKALPSSKENSEQFDVVFLDPPYALPLITPCLEQLLDLKLLNDSAWIYIENSASDSLPPLPTSMQLYRHKTAGQVQYALLHYQATNCE